MVAVHYGVELSERRLGSGVCEERAEAPYTAVEQRPQIPVVVIPLYYRIVDDSILIVDPAHYIGVDLPELVPVYVAREAVRRGLLGDVLIYLLSLVVLAHYGIYLPSGHQHYERKADHYHILCAASYLSVF